MSNILTVEQTTMLLSKKFGSLWPEKIITKEKLAGFAEDVLGWDKENITAALYALQKKHPDTLPSGPEIKEACEQAERDKSLGRKRESGSIPTLADDFYCAECNTTGSFYAVAWWGNWQPVKTLQLIRHPAAVMGKIAVVSLPCVCDAGTVYCSARVSTQRRYAWKAFALPGCWTDGFINRDRFGREIKDEHGMVVRNEYYLTPAAFGWMFVEFCNLANLQTELFDKLNKIWFAMARKVFNQSELAPEEQNLDGWQEFIDNFEKARSMSSTAKKQNIAAPVKTAEDVRREYRERGGVQSIREMRL